MEPKSLQEELLEQRLFLASQLAGEIQKNCLILLQMKQTGNDSKYQDLLNQTTLMVGKLTERLANL